MAVKTVTKLYGVDDCKLFPITQDTSSTFTCSTGIDLAGVRQISLTFEIDEKTLTGDEKVLEISNKIKSVTFSAEYAKLNLEVLAQLTGGTLTGTGTTSAVYSFGEGDLSGYFQLQAQIKDTSNQGGDCHIVIYKAKASAVPINGVQDDFATFTFNGRGVFTEHQFGSVPKAKLIDIILNETATPLSAITENAQARVKQIGGAVQASTIA